MKAPREGDIVRVCLEYLHQTGWMAWRNNSGAWKVAERFIRFGEKGSADILGIKDGVPLAVECKMPGKKPRESQTVWADNWQRHGGVYLLVHSVGELVDGLKALEAKL